MRIGVDVRELQEGVWTGIGRVVEAFLIEARALRPDVELFLYGDRTTRAGLGNGDSLRRLSQPTTLWFDQLSLPAALREDRVDVFFSPYYKAPLRSPCPFVVTIHDLIFLRIGSPRLKHRAFKPWARLIVSRSGAVLTDSEHSRRDLEEVLVVDPAKIAVVPLGVSPRYRPEARKGSPQLPKTLGITGKYILNVTNFLPHKNAAGLLRAFAAVAATDPSLTLVLAGRRAGPIDDLISFMDRHGLKGRVFLPGPIPEEDLPALYAGAHVFAFPSLYEGFGLPVLEAMASGVPVVCSSRSSLPEVTAEAALLIDPEDEDALRQALLRVVTDEALRQRLRSAGLRRAEAFPWRESVARILSVLERVAGAS